MHLKAGFKQQLGQNAAPASVIFDHQSQMRLARCMQRVKGFGVLVVTPGGK